MSVRPIVLRGGRVLDPSRDVDEKADVLIVDGKIASAKGKIGSKEDADAVLPLD